MAEVNKEELRRLAEAMPELDWDSQFEAFEQTGFCSVYAPPFEIDGELMDGHTYVELCHRHEAQFIAGAKEAVLSLLDENAAQAARIAELERECERLREDHDKEWRRSETNAQNVIAMAAELEACRKDAERWRYFRDRLGEPVDSDVFSAFNAWLWAEAPIEDVEAAIDAAMQEGGV